MTWTRLLDDESHGGCATDDCHWPATWGRDGKKFCNRCRLNAPPSTNTTTNEPSLPPLPAE